MEAESVQVIHANTSDVFQDRLSKALISCQEDSHNPEVHYSTCYGGNKMHYTAVVIGRSTDYWSSVGAPG